MVDAVAGPEVGTELAWGYADERSLPRLVYVNKMDRENASFQRTIEQLREKFEGTLIPIHLPLGEQSAFKGVIDVTRMKAVGKEGKDGDCPPDLAEAAAPQRREESRKRRHAERRA